MVEKETIELLVEGGKAAPDASSAGKLASHQLNIGEVFKKINEKTAEYKGMQVPVKIVIDKENKTFEIKIGVPPVSSLIKKELGIEKAKTAQAEKAGEEKKITKESAKAGEEKVEKEEATEEGEAEAAEEGESAETEEGVEEGVAKKEGEEVIGNLTMKQVVKIAKMKMDDLLAKDLKAAVKQVVGTANSMMGIRIEGKKPKDVIVDIEKGKYDSLLKE